RSRRAAPEHGIDAAATLILAAGDRKLLLHWIDRRDQPAYETGVQGPRIRRPGRTQLHLEHGLHSDPLVEHGGPNAGGLDGRSVSEEVRHDGHVRIGSRDYTAVV